MTMASPAVAAAPIAARYLCRRLIRPRSSSIPSCRTERFSSTSLFGSYSQPFAIPHDAPQTHGSSQDATCVPDAQRRSFASSASSSATQSQPTSSLIDLFPTLEYSDPNSPTSPFSIKPLPHPPLDKPSRFLLSLLNDSLIGVRRHSADKPTTSRCNRMLEMICDRSIGGNKLEGRVERADEILKRMEHHLFRAAEHEHATTNALYTNSGNATSGSTNAVTGRRQVRDIRDAYQHKMEVPHPNRKSYLLVLKLYAQTSGPSSYAERAQEIVHNMEMFSHQLNDVSLRPNVVHYNQVISCWANSTDGDKVERAHRYLEEMRRNGRVGVDASSYGHFLRACATTSEDDEDAKRVALRIAIGLWKELDGGGSVGVNSSNASTSNAERNTEQTEAREQPPPLTTSFFYTFLLRTLGFLPTTTSPQIRQRDNTLRRAFEHCCRDGMVNAHVLHMLQLVASERLYDEMVGEKAKWRRRNVGQQDSSSSSSSSSSSATRLAREVPTRWTRNARTGNSWGW